MLPGMCIAPCATKMGSEFFGGVCGYVFFNCGELPIIGFRSGILSQADGLRKGEIIFYESGADTRIEVRLDFDTVWLTVQKDASGTK